MSLIIDKIQFHLQFLAILDDKLKHFLDSPWKGRSTTFSRLFEVLVFEKKLVDCH